MVLRLALRDGQVLAMMGVDTSVHTRLSHRRLEHAMRALNNGSGASSAALLVDYDELYESVEMHGQL